MAGLLKVVSPEGILHFVLDETTAKGDFCHAHMMAPSARASRKRSRATEREEPAAEQ